MARPMEFDRDSALEAAMLLFWRQGYTATSLHQLLETMEIGRSSFYAAFHDKRSLFVEALQLFAGRSLALLLSQRDSEEPLNAVVQFFEKTVREVPLRRVQRGCMMVNTVLELAEVDNELSRLATDELGQVEAGFVHCFERAMALGHYQSPHSAEQLARHVMTLNQGIRVAARKKQSKVELMEIISTDLKLLGIN